jgi:hypothetical protein
VLIRPLKSEQLRIICLMLLQGQVCRSIDVEVWEHATDLAWRRCDGATALELGSPHLERLESIGSIPAEHWSACGVARQGAGRM